jgi:hypothetical protein
MCTLYKGNSDLLFDPGVNYASLNKEYLKLANDRNIICLANCSNIPLSRILCNFVVRDTVWHLHTSLEL